MSFPLKPSKRPHDGSTFEWRKRPRSFRYELQPLKIHPGTPFLRILCLITQTGSVLGHGGSTITRIRKATRAKIRLMEPVDGDEERVIVIMGPDKKVKSNNDNIPDESDKVKEDEKKNEGKVSSPVVDTHLDKEAASVQKALYLVFERMVFRESKFDEGGREVNKANDFVVRLLVLSSQVGCIQGKEGKLIRQMESESRAQILILRDKLPKCTSACDAIVQLTGKVEAVWKALQLVSDQLLKNSPCGDDALPTNQAIGPLSHPSAPPNIDTHQPLNFQFPAQVPLYSSDTHHPLNFQCPAQVPLYSSDTHHPANFQFPAQVPLYSSGPQDGTDYHLNGPQSAPRFHEAIVPSRMRPHDITFRLLCHNVKVGGLVGKEGETVKTIHLETGCDIRILDALPYSEDHIIVISGPVHPDDVISAVQRAVLRVQDRMDRGVPDNIEKIVTSRIILSSSQICFLLGSGGSIIAEIRRRSGAYISIVPKNKVPKSFAENEEIVQITGELKSVQEALLQITSWLRQHILGDAFPSVNYPVHPPFHHQAPPFPYMSRREPLLPGMYSIVGDLPPHGLNHPQDEQSTFAHNIHRQGFPHSSARILSSTQWEPQGINVGGSMGISEYAKVVAQRRL